MTQKNPTYLNTVLKTLDDINKDITFSFSVPSSDKEYSSKILNTDQLKRLFKSIIESPSQTSLFTQTFNSIMEENILNEDVSNFTILDKLVYFIKLRINSISNIYTIDLSENSKVIDDSYGYDLNYHVENVLNKVESPKELEISEISPYKVICCLPNIKVENTLENELHKNLDVEIKTPEELRQLVGDTFINEITKYVKSISLSAENIDFNALDFKSRITIVSKLPSTIINKILKYMEAYKTISEKITTCNFTCYDSEGKVVKLEEKIPFDTTFFNE